MLVAEKGNKLLQHLVKTCRIVEPFSAETEIDPATIIETRNVFVALSKSWCKVRRGEMQIWSSTNSVLTPGNMALINRRRKKPLQPAWCIFLAPGGTTEINCVSLIYRHAPNKGALGKWTTKFRNWSIASKAPIIPNASRSIPYICDGSLFVSPSIKLLLSVTHLSDTFLKTSTKIICYLLFTHLLKYDYM